MRVGLLSPYHGGSHQGWAEGWRRHSAHEIRILSLPARFWKWRMHGAAVNLSYRLPGLADVDALVATDMLDLAAFLGLSRRATARLPILLYMHENQVTYPLPADGSTGPMRRQGGERDRHYGWINVTSMLAADRIVFNSEFHRDDLLGALPGFLRRFPDFREPGLVPRLREHSGVLPVGLRLDDIAPPAPDAARALPPLVIWNQRWEYDKDPGALMRVLCRLADDGESFRVALCGQRFGRLPPELEAGIERLGGIVVHAGHLPRERYVRVLAEASVVISTARHEFFGVAVAEAVAAGAWPLVPDRLAYPELLPADFHEHCLYGDDEDLTHRLRDLLRDPGAGRARVVDLAERVRDRLSWSSVAPEYDRAIERLVAARSDP